MSIKKRTDVLVAGAGPVGLLSAVLLRQQGVDVTIVDKGQRTATRTYALALHPRSLDVLDGIGLAETVIAEGRVLERLAFFEQDACRASVPLSESGANHSFVVSLPQARLEHLLEEKLAALGTHVLWGHRLAGVECGTADSSARACVEKLGMESLGYGVAGTVPIVLRDHHLEASFVLAADGHTSLTRQVLAIDFPEVSDPELFAVFEIAVERELPPEVRVFFHDETINVLWPLPGGRCRFSFQLLDAAELKRPRVKSRLLVELGDDALALLPEGTLGRLLAERAPWFDLGYEDVRWSMIVSFEQRLATRFGRGRVWLLGDAAHLASPVMCRSMNLGFIEAHEACRAIAGVLEDGEPMATFERQRDTSHKSWCDLWRSDTHVHPGRQADEWLAARAQSIMACIPGTESERTRYGARLGLGDAAAPESGLGTTS